MRLLSRTEAAALVTSRANSLFDSDVLSARAQLEQVLRGARVLVIGGAGSIGAATTAELSRFPLAALHVVDANENGLAELVRDLRGRAEGLALRDFRTTPADFGAPFFERLLRAEEPYDYVLNFAAIKHVRSEKDVFSLLQMFDTNLVKADRLLGWLAARGGTKRYFCVSTDKAANPVNLMGATKRLMEHVMFAHAGATAAGITLTSARFANVAFSAGSLLEGWLYRLEKGQPLPVPRETRRYFVSMREAGQLCLLAAVVAPDRSIVIPRLDESLLIELEVVARAVLGAVGFEPALYDDEQAARAAVGAEVAHGRYPLLRTPLDTSGEKAFEEFVGAGESTVEIGLPNLLAVVYSGVDATNLRSLRDWVTSLVRGDAEALPSKEQVVRAVRQVIPEFAHIETDRQLDQRL
jgi:FlaA1/EpsC-like NDP-sugar epimerase